LVLLVVHGATWGQTPPPDASAGAPPTAAAPTPAATPAPTPADPDGLIRYVPKDGLIVLVEFQGIDSHHGAWSQSAASKILSETKTGAMFRSLLSQLQSQLPADVAMSTEDRSTLTEHLLRSGTVASLHSSAGKHGFTLVIRDAFRDDIRPSTARFVRGMMKPGTKPEMVDKPGGRRVAIVEPPQPAPIEDPRLAWWVEDRKDIVVAAPPDHADTVIAALSDGSLSAKGHSIRAKLAARSGKVEPVGWMFVDLSALATVGSMPPQISQLGLDRAKSFNLRWGLDGQAMQTLIELEAPAPRTGILALADQPTFDAANIPALPENTESFSVTSFDLDSSLSKLTELAAQLGQADVEQQLADAEAAFKKATKLDLRADVLRRLGPRMITYNPKKKTSGAMAALNSVNPLAGMQIPPFAVLIEIDDAKAMNRTLTSLMSYTNKQLATAMAPPEPPEGAGAAPPGAPGAQRGGYPGQGRPGAGGSGRSSTSSSSARNAQAISIRMTSPEPLTYQLSIPPQMAAMLTIKPTLTLGKSHIIVASSPELAKEALDLESSGDARWVPSGDFAQAVAGLPGKLVYLQVTDPRDTIPQAITGLPTSLENAIAAVRAAASGATTMAAAPVAQPGFPSAGGGGPPGFDDVSAAYRGRGPGTARENRGPPPGGFSGNSGGGPPGGFPGASGGGTPAGYPGSSGGGTPAGYPGSSGGGTPPGFPGSGSSGGQFAGPATPAAAAPTGPIKFQIASDDMPKAADIRPLLFPGSFVVAVDDQGIHMIGRDAFFGVDSLVELLNVMPMIAAQARVQIPGTTPNMPQGAPVPGGAPAGFPGAPGGGFPGAPGGVAPAGPPPGGFPGLSGGRPPGSSGGARRLERAD
jgi:hypothetical protein